VKGRTPPEPPASESKLEPELQPHQPGAALLACKSITARLDSEPAGVLELLLDVFGAQELEPELELPLELSPSEPEEPEFEPDHAGSIFIAPCALDLSPHVLSSAPCTGPE